MFDVAIICSSVGTEKIWRIIFKSLLHLHYGSLLAAKNVT